MFFKALQMHHKTFSYSGKLLGSLAAIGDVRHIQFEEKNKHVSCIGEDILIMFQLPITCHDPVFLYKDTRLISAGEVEITALK